MPRELSILVDTLPSAASKKLGQPDPDSYLEVESKSTSLQTVQIYSPFLFSSSNFPENGGSVPQN